jgi:hypothetical protein
MSDKTIIKLRESNFSRSTIFPDQEFDLPQQSAASTKNEPTEQSEYDSDDSENVTVFRARDPISGRSIKFKINSDINVEGKILNYDPVNKALIISDPPISNQLVGEAKLDQVMSQIRATSRKYSFWAQFYKYLNYAFAFAMLGVQGTLLYFANEENKLANTILVVISLVLTGIYVALNVGNIGKRYRSYVYVLNMKHLEAEEAKGELVNDADFERYASMLTREIEKISMDVYNMSYGPNEIGGSGDNSNPVVISSSHLSAVNPSNDTVYNSPDVAVDIDDVA